MASHKDSIPTVCFIVGLCGSGKSHLATEMAWDWCCHENFASKPALQNELIQRLRHGQSCIVTEGAFMFEDGRTKVVEWLRQQVPSVRIEWIYFENDLETANWNCRHRTNKGSPEGHADINDRMHKLYSIPNGVKTLRIHKLEVPSLD